MPICMSNSSTITTTKNQSTYFRFPKQPHWNCDSIYSKKKPRFTLGSRWKNGVDKCVCIIVDWWCIIDTQFLVHWKCKTVFPLLIWGVLLNDLDLNWMEIVWKCYNFRAWYYDTVHEFHSMESITQRIDTFFTTRIVVRSLFIQLVSIWKFQQLAMNRQLFTWPKIAWGSDKHDKKKLTEFQLNFIIILEHFLSLVLPWHLNNSMIFEWKKEPRDSQFTIHRQTPQKEKQSKKIRW